MIAPVWARWLLGVAMLIVTGYHLVRIVRRYRGAHRTARVADLWHAAPVADLWHAAMAAGMGLMALGVVGHGAGWWLLMFGIGAAVLAGRALDRYVVGGVLFAAHDLRQLVAGVAMCWMLGAPVSMAAAAGAAPDAGARTGDTVQPVVAVDGGLPHSMAGMVPGPGSSADPAVLTILLRGATVLMLAAVLALAVWSCWMMLRLRLPSHWLPGRRRAPGEVVGAVSPSGRTCAPACCQGCQAAMHVTAALMLVAMV